MDAHRRGANRLFGMEMMKLFIGKIICKWFGHMRGKRISVLPPGVITWRCPRCGHTWSRKYKAKEQAQ